MAISISISITQNSQSISDNTSNVKCSVVAKWTGGSYNKLQKSGYLIIDGTKYTFTSSFNTGQATSGSQTLFSKTVNVSHATNGTKTLSCSASYTSGVSSGTVTASASKVLTTIPRKSTLSVANGTLGTAHTLSVTRQSTSFTHTITYTCGSVSGTICTKSTATSINFTPPIDLAKQNTTGTGVSITFKIETFNGSTSLGSNSYTKTYTIPDSVKPSVSFTTEDPTGNLSTYGKYVSGKSTVAVKITAVGSYDSTIKSYSTTIDGKSYTEASFTSDILTGNGTLTVSVTVKDSRGRTATASKDISVYAYASPKITALTIKRCDSSGASSASGAYLGITFSASVTSLDSKNTATYQVKYKKVSDTAYTTATISGYANNYAVTNGTFAFAADVSSSYDVILSVIDAFGTVGKTIIGGTTNKLLSLMRKGLGIALGKVAELENALDVNFDLYSRKTSYFKGDMYDKFDKVIGNGLASYGSGDNAHDPDTTSEHLILTNVNTPMGSSYFMYIHTFFYNTKSGNRAQYAIPYNRIGSMYHRYYADGAWSDWRRHTNADELSDYVIDRGTSGMWTWEKWDSGKAVCYGRYSGNITLATAQGSNYYSNINGASRFDYPSGLFVSTPMEHVSMHNTGYYCWIETGSSNTQTQTGIYRVVRETKSSTTYTVYLDFYSVGKWK